MSIIRDITIKAKKYLETDEVLLIVGSRQAGKTTILRQLREDLDNQKKNTFFLNLEEMEYLGLLNESPRNLFKIFTLDLNQKNYVFIDEIQYLKNPSNFLKFIFDEYQGKIKLIVSGSSAFYIDKKFKDSLAGRKKIFHVTTLSFREFLRFKQVEKLAHLDFSKLSLTDKEKISVYFGEYVIFGGYPKVVLSVLGEKKEILQEIAFSYIKKDVYEANIKQEETFYKLFKILASQAGNLLNASELAKTLGVSKTTIDNFLYVMQKSFHIVLIRPFYKNMRKELTRMPKVYFADLGLRNFFMNDFGGFEQRGDKGILLENIVFRQLSDKFEGDEIKFWRTIGKHEIDFIVDEKNALEVKVDSERLRVKNYKIFQENYPKIDFSVVTLNKKNNAVNDIKILDAWEL
ncbi:MAG: hypothetical protein ACD_7C00086G0002 [uncultured bacterium]|nr:MAG: hypothetical protein ACD_7C00086G0002 [uncultured bacterium]HBR78910.1 hypothetical protein [Candidatus Moranbacteria bacterium]